MTFPPQQERVQACVYEEFFVPSADAETLLSGAKQTLTNAIPSVEMHVSQEGQKVFANDKGLTILERLDQLGTDVRDLRSELRDTQSELRSVQRVFYDARERTYLTYLQDCWDDFGTARHSSAKKTPLQMEVVRKVNALNSGRVYAGDSESDAAMYTARQPFHSDFAFEYLYELSAPEINDIIDFARATLALNLCPKRVDSSFGFQLVHFNYDCNKRYIPPPKTILKIINTLVATWAALNNGEVREAPQPLAM